MTYYLNQSIRRKHTVVFAAVLSLVGCAGEVGDESLENALEAPADPHAQHSTHGTGANSATLAANGPGPAINDALIPSGDPGIDYLAIRPSKDVPHPDQGGIGAFRTECPYSHMNYDDPLVFPGQPGAAHLHTYFGNTETNAHSTPESLRSGSRSTCRGGLANRSAYWVPSIIDTSSGAPIKPHRGAMYYKTGYGGVKPADVKAFPQGLRMLAGDPKATSSQPHAYWGCMESYVGRLANIPECGAGNHVSLTIAFPQCWNGRDVDSSDHRSHMAYPAEDGSGCPASHPVPIPEITFNIFYDNPASGTASWRLSSDMYDPSLPGGMSAHGDWMDGWQPDVVATWITNCSNKAVDCSSHMLGDGREIYYTDTL